MDALVEFFRHNTMMNERLVEACRGLSPEQLAATAEGTYGSLGATLVHVADSQLNYTARLLDTDRPEGIPHDPFPGFEVLEERFALGNRRLEEAAARGNQEREVVVGGGDPSEGWRMPVSLFLVQAVVHGVEHRSQIATILTQQGIEPPGMEGWDYFFDGGLMAKV